METLTVRARRRRYRIVVPEGDHIGRELSSGRPYENDLLAAMRQLVRPGDVIIDVGANIGNHTLYFALICGARVHAFEPNPETLAFLEKNVAVNGLQGRVIVYPQALSDTPKRVTVENMYRDHGLAMARTLDDADGQVQASPLDDIAIAGPVALIKIDVEGAEQAVLSGARATIARDRPLLAIEAKTGQARHALDAFLAPLGYWRFPIAFAATPTYICLPRKRVVLRLLAHAGLLRSRKRLGSLRAAFRVRRLAP